MHEDVPAAGSNIVKDGQEVARYVSRSLFPPFHFSFFVSFRLYFIPPGRNAIVSSDARFDYFARSHE